MLGRVKVKRILKLKFVCTLVYCSHRHTHTRADTYTHFRTQTHTQQLAYVFFYSIFSLFVFILWSLVVCNTCSQANQNETKLQFCWCFFLFQDFLFKSFFQFTSPHTFHMNIQKENKTKNNIYYILKKQQKVFVVAKRNKTKKWYIYINIYCIHLSIYTFVYTCIFSMPTTYVICRDFEFFQVKTPQSKYSSALP